MEFSDGSRAGGHGRHLGGDPPRDELARDCGLEVGPRGGVVVDDLLATSDPHIFAIGEVACIAA